MAFALVTMASAARADERLVASDSLAAARAMADWIVTAEADSLWRVRAPGLDAGMFVSADSLRASLGRVRTQLGDRLVTLEERMVWAGGLRQYWRLLQSDQLAAPVLLRVMLDEHNRLAGLGIGGAAQIPQIDSGGPVLRPAGATGIPQLSDPSTPRVRSAAALGIALVLDTLGPGVISLPEGENYRGTFSLDGREFYFFRRTGAGETYRIFVAARGASGWLPPRELDLGGPFSDLYPTMSADGNTLVFTSYRPLPGTTLERPNSHLWRARRQGSRWVNPEPLTELNEPGRYHAGPRFVASGDLTWSAQSQGVRDVRVATCRSGSCTAPRPDTLHARFAARLPAGHVLWDVVAAPHGNVAVLSVSVRPNWQPDLWVSARGRDGWSSPVPLPREVNGAGSENFPSFTPDGRCMVFVRDYKAFLMLDVETLRSVAMSRQD